MIADLWPSIASSIGSMLMLRSEQAMLEADPLVLGQLSKPRLLIMGGFGHLPFAPAKANRCSQFISRRYEEGSILITYNRAVGHRGTVLGN